MQNKPQQNSPITTEQKVTEKEKARQKLNPKFDALQSIFLCDDTHSITTESLSAISNEMNDQLEKIRNGNLSVIEDYLYSQAITLHQMFESFFRSYLMSSLVEEQETYGKLAFKAQSHARKTLLALAEIRNPKRAMFIKQQNNAIHQQVNNSEKI